MIIPNLSNEIVRSALREALNNYDNKHNDEREYMLDFYEGYTEQYIRKFFGSESLQQVPIFNQNLTRRISSIRSMSYKRPPRMLTDSRYESFIDLSGLNQVRRQLERLTFLLGTMAFRCRWSELNQRVEYDLLPFFETLFLENENEPVGIMYAIQQHGNQRDQEMTYAVWTAERPGFPGQHYLLKNNGEKISVNDQDLNPYGILPVLFSHKQPPVRDFYCPGADDVIKADLSLSVGMTELSLAIRFGALGIKFITNIDDASRVELGVDKILYLPENSTLGVTGPSGSLTDIISSLRFMTEATLQNNNIRVKFADTHGNAPSAEALRIQDAELMDERSAAVEDTWRPWEKRRYQIDRRIIEVKANVQLKDEYGVDFIEPLQTILTPRDEIEYWNWRFENNLATPEDWFIINNPDYSKAQLEQFQSKLAPKQEADQPVNRLLNRLQDANR